MTHTYLIQGISIELLIEKLITAPESSKDEIKAKEKIAHCMERLAEVTLFRDQLLDQFLPLLKLENLMSIQDHKIHSRLVDLTKTLYLRNGHEKYDLILSNMNIFLEAMAAMISHEQTKTSQNAIQIFHRIVQMVESREKSKV